MAKGGLFERDLCKLLSRWWLGREDEDVAFWRSAGSGGRATTRAKKGKTTTAAHCGDVCATDARGAALTALVAVVAKKGYTSRVSVAGLLREKVTAPPRSYAAWIQQATDSAYHARAEYWWLVHGADGQSPANATLTMPAELWDRLRLDQRRVAPPIIRLTVRDRWAPPGEIPSGGTASFVACVMGAFLGGVTPDAIRRISPRGRQGQVEPGQVPLPDVRSVAAAARQNHREGS